MHLQGYTLELEHASETQPPNVEGKEAGVRVGGGAGAVLESELDLIFRTGADKTLSTKHPRSIRTLPLKAVRCLSSGRCTHLRAAGPGDEELAVGQRPPLGVGPQQLVAGRTAAVQELVVLPRCPGVPVHHQLVRHGQLTDRAGRQLRRQLTKLPRANIQISAGRTKLSHGDIQFSAGRTRTATRQRIDQDQLTKKC